MRDRNSIRISHTLSRPETTLSTQKAVNVFQKVNDHNLSESNQYFLEKKIEGKKNSQIKSKTCQLKNCYDPQKENKNSTHQQMKGEKKGDVDGR